MTFGPTFKRTPSPRSSLVSPLIENSLYESHKVRIPVLVHTVDSDVIVILVTHFSRFDSCSPGCQLFVSFGYGKTRRVIDIQKVCQALGPQRCLAIPLWVALTGCDSTSSMRGRSKRTSFNEWKKSCAVVTSAMNKLLETPFSMLQMESQQFKQLESFFVDIYGGGSTSINEQRKEMFCHRNQNPEMIPPTQNALYHHCQRALYQASIWKSANVAEMKAPDPTKHGWRKEGQRLLPVWISIPEVSIACQELLKCGCKRPCGNACSCKKKSLNCTALCKCNCIQ